MRYIQDPETKELVPADQYVPKHVRKSAGYYVMPDIQPYKSVITGEVIGSRSKHRKHLRDHGCIEVGNEKVKPKPLPEVPGRREAIIQAMKKHGALRY